MQTQDLFQELKTKYPNIKFSLNKSTELGLEDNYEKEELAKLPEHLITFEMNDISIWDPFCSDCSRFKINPKEEYGIEEEDANRIVQHNKLTMHG
jgi:hypothetical protein